MFNHQYRLIDTITGSVIEAWGDATGGIAFRVNNGSIHHLDESVELQTRMLESILKYYLTLKHGI